MRLPGTELHRMRQSGSGKQTGQDFLEDYGWTPVEVTPAADGSYQTSYPGLDADVLNELADSTIFNPDGMDNDRETSSEEESGNAESGRTVSWDLSSGFFRSPVLIRAAFTVLAVCFLTLLLFLYFRRRKRIKKLEQMKCRRIFGRLMDMLHFAGYMSACNGTEEDFAEKLSGELPCINRDEAEQMTEIVRQAAYGQTEPSEKETEFVRAVYCRAAEFLREEQTGLRKLRFRYTKVFY